MPSNAYYAEFRPDPLLRQIVLWSGGCLGICGLVAIGSLPWPPAWLAATGALWAVRSTWEIWRLRSTWKACRGLRISADGDALLLDADGEWRGATLLDGGVLLRRWGWLRLRTASGRVFAEPLRGSCRKSRDWRRLQVIWRHVGAAG